MVEMNAPDALHANTLAGLAARIYKENQVKLLEYLDWCRDDELAALLPTGYAVVDNYSHLVATRCIVANRFLGQPSPLPWEAVKQFSRIFPPRPADKPLLSRRAVVELLEVTLERIAAGFATLDARLGERRVFDAKYRSLSLHDKLVTQAAHETYHTGMIGGYRSVLVLRRANPNELSEFLAAHPCALSDQQESDARVFSDWS